MNPPWWARPIAALLFGAVWPVRVHGAENVPPRGPVILASNHSALLDGPLLIAASPRWTVCLVKAEAFRGLLGAIMRRAGMIPVERHTGDRAALTAALGVLESSGVLGMFPEGTRGRGDVAAVQQGVAWLALRSGAPVVPAACLGVRRTGEGTNHLPRPRRRLDVVFGPPLAVAAPDGVPGRTALAHATASVRDALAEHVTRAVELTGQSLPEDLGWSPEQVARGEHL